MCELCSMQEEIHRLTTGLEAALVIAEESVEDPDIVLINHVRKLLFLEERVDDE